MAARQYNTVRKYRPKKQGEVYQPDFSMENDFDFISPYPCGVCGREFRSRHELATHPHQRRNA